MKNRSLFSAFRILAGALLGAVLVPVVFYFWWGTTLVGVGEGAPVSAFGSPYLLVFADMASAFGSAEAAAVVQALLGALLGGVVACATLPFAEDGRTLVKRSLLHFLATETAFLLLILVCRWGTGWWIALLDGSLLALLYLLIWLGRWTGWYLEVVELRDLLGLSPGPTPLKWRETLPYLPLVCLMCLGIPAALWAAEQLLGSDLPVLSGLMYPYLLLPTASFCIGVFLGKRRGFCPLLPAACFVCYLPTVYLLFNPSALIFSFLAALPALAGNLAGWLGRKWKHARQQEELR